MQNKLSYVQLYCFVQYYFQGEGVTGHLNPTIYLCSKAVITSDLHFKHSQWIIYSEYLSKWKMYSEHSFSQEFLPRVRDVQGFPFNLA